MAASRMSASGQSRRVGYGPTTSGLPRLADILRVGRHVSKVPTTDTRQIDSPLRNRV